MKRLEYQAGITDDECDRLRKLGVLHTNQLIHATTLVIDRERIQRRSGIPVERLYYLGQQASLMEISGLTRRWSAASEGPQRSVRIGGWNWIRHFEGSGTRPSGPSSGKVGVTGK